MRVSRDIRLNVHHSAPSLLLCYVDHHDQAYRWAERRKLETYPITGAPQFVEARERVEESTAPKYVEVTPAPFSDAALQQVYDTERHLLYVACTRARDCLLVSGAYPASEFLDDLADELICTPGR